MAANEEVDVVVVGAGAWADELIKKEGIGSHEICVTPVYDVLRTALAAREIGGGDTSKMVNPAGASSHDLLDHADHKAADAHAAGGRHG